MTGASATIGEVLRAVGDPVVEVAWDEPVESIARLIVFTGLPAVLLVRPCGRAERIVSMRDVLLGLAGTSSPEADDPLPRCHPEEGFHAAAGALLRCGGSAILVERDGIRLGLVTLAGIAGYLAKGRGPSARGL